MNDLKTFLLNFLESIDYSESKEEFIDNFTSVIYLKSIETLLNTFPQDKQESIRGKLSSATSAEALMTVVNGNFDQKAFQDTARVTSEKVFNEYLDTIQDVLTDEQKSRLQQFLQSISTPATP